MKITKITNNSLETSLLGEEIAKKILKDRQNKKAQVLALYGDLGTGKTTFLQGFAKGLGIKERVLSPTFVIFKKFKIQDSFFNLFYHIDCYRLKDSKDLLSLGFEEFSSNSKNIIAIEWSEIVEDILPENKISIHFEFKDEKRRIITIK